MLTETIEKNVRVCHPRIRFPSLKQQEWESLMFGQLSALLNSFD